MMALLAVLALRFLRRSHTKKQIARARRVKSSRPLLLVFKIAAFIALLTLAPSAHATDPDRVEWSKDWPRVHLVEVVDVVGLTAASYAISAYWTPLKSPNWSGGILFDNWVRNELKGNSYATQHAASEMADTLYKTGTLGPYIIDVYFVALGVHQNADVALQMGLMNLQSLGLSGVTTLAAEHLVGRARPYVQDCNAQGNVLDAHGNPLLNHCDGVGDYQSFWSGHVAAVGTMAGLTCVHHQHLPLYGGGFADLAPCLLMIGAAVTTGIGRMVSDRHWASDVITGGVVAFGSGYLLPSALHYGFNGGKPIGEVQTKAFRFVPTPMVLNSGGGLSLNGMF
jgi:membrane-associated phospholipid phosphatase